MNRTNAVVTATNSRKLDTRVLQDLVLSGAVHKVRFIAKHAHTHKSVNRVTSMTNGDPSLLGRLQYELAKQPDIVRYIPIARRYLFKGIVLLYTID